MTTPRPTSIYTLSRRAVLQCLGLGALATAWPASAAILAGENEDEEFVDSLPAWLTYPEQQWQRITPTEAGIDTVAYEKLLAQSQIGPKGWGGTQPDDTQWGAVLTRGGYLVQTWGDPAFKTQSASLGKCITRALIGISAERGRLKLDEPISRTWTGRGQLSHEHKCLDQGHHARLTWRQLINHQGGFVLESGYHWRTGIEFHGVIPPWATTTKDPLYDNYAHGESGQVTHYSSGGYWRLGQALTALWDQDLKQVLQDELFSHLGIPADRWDWLSGQVVHDTRDFYPAFPGYGEYVDPPYEINGHVVRGAPGWFVILADRVAGGRVRGRLGNLRLRVALGCLRQSRGVRSAARVFRWPSVGQIPSGCPGTGRSGVCLSAGIVGSRCLPTVFKAHQPMCWEPPSVVCPSSRNAKGQAAVALVASGAESPRSWHNFRRKACNLTSNHGVVPANPSVRVRGEAVLSNSH